MTIGVIYPIIAVNKYGGNCQATISHFYGIIMEGAFPPKAAAMVKEFILKYQKELEKMWETEKYIKPPPLN